MESLFKKKLRKEFDRFLLRRTNVEGDFAEVGVFKGNSAKVHDCASGHRPGVVRAADEFLLDKPEKPILIPDKSGSAALVKV